MKLYFLFLDINSHIDIIIWSDYLTYHITLSKQFYKLINSAYLKNTTTLRPITYTQYKAILNIRPKLNITPSALF